MATGLQPDVVLLQSIKQGITSKNWTLFDPIVEAGIGVADGARNLQCLPHPDNKRKWDDGVRLVGDAAFVTAGSLQLASGNSRPKLLFAALATSLAAKAMTIVGNLANDVPPSACLGLLFQAKPAQANSPDAPRSH